MRTPPDFEPIANEPLSLLASPVERPAAFPDARVERLEFSCRGDRVPCTLVVPRGEGPFPIALLQLEPTGEDLPSALQRARAWVDAGCALASIDLPLHGDRTSAKLSEELATAFVRAKRGESVGDTAALLWLEFTRQAVMELRRTLDLVGGLPTIDAQRIGYAGFGLGAFVGAIVCALDRRLRAAVLAGCGSGIAPEPIAPEAYVGRIAPTPVLFVDDDAPGAVPRNAAEKLCAAAGEPKQVVRSSDPAHALDVAWTFLSKTLG